ncbi:hypothetical protein BD779DRAFT_1680084 [Infundibulicybe gibba]|nr:hypothetical protein BD779DRAFT_1680084 [Infundibulicybe gibba]
MPLGILNSIIDSVHYFKIHTTDDLAKETQWDEVDRYGDEIVALISRICPCSFVKTPLTTPTPPHPVSSIHGLNTKPDPTSFISTELEPTVPAEEKNGCGTRGGIGHDGMHLFAASYYDDRIASSSIARSQLCPKNPMNQSVEENRVDIGIS